MLAAQYLKEQLLRTGKGFECRVENDCDMRGEVETFLTNDLGCGQRHHYVRMAIQAAHRRCERHSLRPEHRSIERCERAG